MQEKLGRKKATTPIRILIADDCPIFRHGIRAFLDEQMDFVIVGEADDASGTLRACSQLSPDILLLDLHLFDSNGKALIGLLCERFPEIKQVVFLSPDDKEGLTACITHGVNGYVLKNAFPDVILAAIRSVIAGEYWLQPEMTSALFDHLRQVRLADQRRFDGNLSDREIEVMKLLARGMRNQEIANQLFISERTVKVHVANIFDKLGVRDRVEAARYAIRSGLVSA